MLRALRPLHLCFLMLRRPPRSTLFPTRRSSDLIGHGSDAPAQCRGEGIAALRSDARGARRSEEHTSELQSLRHLVCRLLLEKKKHNPRMRSAATTTRLGDDEPRSCVPDAIADSN